MTELRRAYNINKILKGKEHYLDDVCRQADDQYINKYEDHRLQLIDICRTLVLLVKRSAVYMEWPWSVSATGPSRVSYLDLVSI